ncbi:MAG: hypothetical protein O2861_06085 [Proteobacteria bacterium]|nr:hypothetical protein [Pseudomonadota bacterium]
MLLLAVFLHVRSPRLYAWIILRSMRDKADLQNSHAADMPQSREAPVNTLEIAEYDEEAVALTDRYQEFEILQVLQGNSSRVFATGTLCSLFVSAIVIVVFASATQSLDIDHLLAILTPFGPQLLVVVMKLVSGSDLKNWQALLLGVISHAGILLPGYEEPLIPQSTALIFLGLHLFMIGLSSFVARFSTQLKLRNAGIAAPNLLLLRVFGVDRNSHGAFRTFANKWTNLGPMLTIVDGSCAAFDFRSRVNQLLPVLILPFLLFLLLVIFDGIAVIMVVITVAAVFHNCIHNSCCSFHRPVLSDCSGGTIDRTGRGPAGNRAYWNRKILH